MCLLSVWLHFKLLHHIQEVPGSSLGPGGWFIWPNVLRRGTRKRRPLYRAWTEVHRVMMGHGGGKQSQDISLLLLWIATLYMANGCLTSIPIPSFFRHLLLWLTILVFCGIFLSNLLLYKKKKTSFPTCLTFVEFLLQ